MKKLRNMMLCILILATTAIVLACTVYNYKISAKDKKNENLYEFVVENGMSIKEIAQKLEEQGLIHDQRFFMIYVKIFEVNSLKATTYNLSPSMSVEEIVKVLQEGNSYNPNQITMTFREGITFRDVAKVIAKNTNHTYELVMEKASNEKFLNELIEEYWFLTNDILNDEIYYPLEGYLYPETYNFTNKDVTVEEIIRKLLDEMEKKVEPYKDDILASSLSVHEVFTLASMAEMESARSEDRGKIASVFYNRVKLKMSLGSDVTTRYALKIDDYSKVLYTSDYQYKSPYNTRLTDGSMNGKLPVGPISTVSIESIVAASDVLDTDYIYFISNIETLETFFFDNYRDFEIKKAELSSVNKGY